MTIAAAGMDLGCLGEASERLPRQFAAFDSASEWLNSPPLLASALRGTVVLVNFWTFTCINWLRTLPYVRGWAEKYRQQLVVIGVHTPEFEVEHHIDHVRAAVRQLRVEHPVTIDNDYTIWRAFDNHYWPATYLIDARGRIRYRHFGEGAYDEIERAIQRALKDTIGSPDESLVSISPTGVEAQADWNNLKSGENYVGYARTENFASRGGRVLDRPHAYDTPTRLSLHQWALSGDWTLGKQAAVLNNPHGRIQYRFHARDLHLVMGPGRQSQPIRFRVSLDGQLPADAHGVDVDTEGHGLVAEPRLYQLIRQLDRIVDRHFEVEFFDAGVEALAFTFG